MNFKKNDQSFKCVNCGCNVEKLNYSSRDHCNICLYGLHVDIMPGDRLNECKGVLKPIEILQDSKKGCIIVYKCLKCGAIIRNKMAEDDNYEEILKISAHKN